MFGPGTVSDPDLVVDAVRLDLRVEVFLAVLAHHIGLLEPRLVKFPRHVCVDASVLR